MPTQDLESVLKASPLSQTQRADLWDVYHASASADDLAEKLKTIGVPTPVKATLWDLKSSETPTFTSTNEKDAEGNAVVRPSETPNMAGAGPMAGGTIGGIVGGVPGAALGGAAGSGYEQLIRHGKELPGALVDTVKGLVSHPRETLGGMAEGMGQGLQNAGIAAASNAALEYGGQKVMGALGSAAKAVYRGYLKPSLAGTSRAKSQSIVNAAIKEGLPIAQVGKERADVLIKELKTEVESILKKRQPIAQTVHGDIDLKGVADQVRQFARRKYYKPGRPVTDFEAAMKVADNIDSHPALGVPPGSVPVSTPATLTEANEVKRALQQSAGDRAFGMERSAATEAEKRGQHILRKELETRAPAIAPLNARESKLIDVAKALQGAIEREANQNALVGVKSVLAAGAGGVEYGRTGDPTTALVKALAVRALLTPAAASRAAILASRLAKVPGVVPASAARVAIAVASEAQE